MNCTESGDIWKTVETAEINLLEILNQKVTKKNLNKLKILK
jgi:hypothetical protein